MARHWRMICVYVVCTMRTRDDSKGSLLGRTAATGARVVQRKGVDGADTNNPQ